MTKIPSPWQQKKIEKREKQRKINLIRSKHMREEWNRKSTILSRNKKQFSLPAINIGCSGWFYWDWKGIVYPKNSQPAEWFKLYSKIFKTVELNAPFYSWPTFSTVKTWVQQTTCKNFVYSIKVPELITHIKKFKGTRRLINNFDLVADELGSLMGCFLYQLPPSFKFTSTRLYNIINQLNLNRRNVLEFRHKSWWNEEVYKEFKKHKIIFCSSSSPKLPDDLIKTSNEIYIRFHGTSKWYRHNYTKAEIIKWAERIKKSKAKKVWVYFNNDREGFAVSNGKMLKKYLK